jgi:branched-subunit amino acid transport protein
MNVWLSVGGAAIASAAFRMIFLAGSRRIRVPSGIDRLTTVLAPAVTAALLAPRVAAAGGAPTIGPEAIALIVAFPVALRTRSVPATLAVGMPVVWILHTVW